MRIFESPDDQPPLEISQGFQLLPDRFPSLFLRKTEVSSDFMEITISQDVNDKIRDGTEASVFNHILYVVV